MGPLRCVLAKAVDCEQLLRPVDAAQRIAPDRHQPRAVLLDPRTGEPTNSGLREVTVAAATCTVTLSAAQLNTVFAVPGVGRTATTAGFGGGDYQHVYELGGGRRLWLFQDMFFSNDNDLRNSLKEAAHNAGLLQRGNCWGTVGAPRMQNFIGTAQTTPASLAQMRYRGDGPKFVRAGRRRVLYRWADVEDWIANSLHTRTDI